jgi:hypothetical protein
VQQQREVDREGTREKGEEIQTIKQQFMSTCCSFVQRMMGSVLLVMLLLCFCLGFVLDVSSFSICTNIMPLRQLSHPQQQRTVLLRRGDGVMMSIRTDRDTFVVGGAADRDTNRSDHDVPQTTTIIERRWNRMNHNRRHMLSLIGTNLITVATITTTAADAEVITDGKNDVKKDATSTDDGTNNNLTTQLFNPDGSLKDTELVVEAQERTIKLQPSNEAQVIWVDAKPLSTSSNNRKNSNAIASITATTPILQYNIPMKWDNDYIDSTTKERACSRIYTYRIPFQNANSGSGGTSTTMTTDSKTTKEGKRRIVSTSSSSSTNNGAFINRRLQISDILNALPNDDYISQTLRNADIMGGNVRRPNSSADTARTYTDRIYSEFDLAVAPTTCSGGENEDLRLGFCPYDRIFLLSATAAADQFTSSSNSASSESNAMDHLEDLSSRTVDGSSSNPSEYLSILIVESTRSEWQRANADLRRVRGSFIVN